MIQMPPVSRTLRRKGLSIHSRTALASRKVERKIIPKRKEPADHIASQQLSREEIKRNAMLFKRPDFFFEPVCLTPPPAWTCELWSTTLEVHLHYFTEVVNVSHSETVRAQGITGGSGAESRLGLSPRQLFHFHPFVIGDPQLVEPAEVPLWHR